MTQERIKEFIDNYDLEGLARAFAEGDIQIAKEEWKDFITLIEDRYRAKLLERAEKAKKSEITFHIPEESEEMIKISKDGFYYKGERVDDTHNVYERFNDWLKKAEITRRRK